MTECRGPTLSRTLARNAISPLSHLRPIATIERAQHGAALTKAAGASCGLLANVISADLHLCATFVRHTWHISMSWLAVPTLSRLSTMFTRKVSVSEWPSLACATPTQLDVSPIDLEALAPHPDQTFRDWLGVIWIPPEIELLVPEVRVVGAVALPDLQVCFGDCTPVGHVDAEVWCQRSVRRVK